MSWFLFYIKLLQTAFKLLLFEKFLLPQCDRACVVPVEVLLTKKKRLVEILLIQYVKLIHG